MSKREATNGQEPHMTSNEIPRTAAEAWSETFSEPFDPERDACVFFEVGFNSTPAAHPQAKLRRPPMVARTIRTSDALWAAAQATADARGEAISEEIRKFLERYAKKGTK